MLHLDFETRSRINLLTDGVYNYATDLSTQVVMMAFAFDDDPPEIWIPNVTCVAGKVAQVLCKNRHAVHIGDFPLSIKNYIADGGTIAAHNAQFERLMFWYVLCDEYSIPEPKIEQFYCTATQARVNGMPGDLAGCAKALGLNQTKDHRGSQLIKLLSIPKSDGTFLEELDPYVEFAEYCLQDVVVERAISKAMRPLTEDELEDYLVSELINDKGLMIDHAFAEAAVSYAEAEQLDLMGEIKRATKGKVTKARGKNLTNWVYTRLAEDQQRHMHKYKDGEQKLTLDRNARARLLTDPDVPMNVRDVVEFSDFAQASSTGKYQAMLNRCDPEDHRVRGAYILYGAASTHRYSARGLQPHNMPRDSVNYPEVLRCVIRDGEPVAELEDTADESIMQILKKMLRQTIQAAPGKTFVCGDWSQVEGRMLPWLAIGVSRTVTMQAQQKLDAYANQTSDYDVYCQSAEAIFRTDVRRGSVEGDQRRQIGKVAELSLGYGGGIGAFKAMAVNYGVHVNDQEADRIKSAWRNNNPWAPRFWKALHVAAVNAVRNPMTEHCAGRITYCFQPDVMHGTLWCMLPSGRVLAYPGAQAKFVEGKFGPAWQLSAIKAAWKPKADEKVWPRIGLWPGLLAENVTQAACADLLREALATLVLDHDAPVVGHTHDEVLLEVPIAEAEFWTRVLNDTMRSGSEWSEGLPLDVDIWTGPRYRK